MWAFPVFKQLLIFNSLGSEKKLDSGRKSQITWRIPVHQSFWMFFPILIQDFFWHLTFSVTTVNVATTTDKCLLCLTSFCFCRFFFLAVFIAPSSLICTDIYIPWIFFPFDYKESIILNIVFLFYDYSIIICFVLFYLVNLSFPSLGLLVVLSFSILPTLWNLFLVTFISPSRHCYHWLFILGFFNLFIVPIYIYSPLKGCVLHKALNIVFFWGGEYKIVQNIKLTKLLKHYASNVALRLFRFFLFSSH